jgi:hypothetical protein
LPLVGSLIFLWALHLIFLPLAKFLLSPTLILLKRPFYMSAGSSKGLP